MRTLGQLSSEEFKALVSDCSVRKLSLPKIAKKYQVSFYAVENLIYRRLARGIMEQPHRVKQPVTTDPFDELTNEQISEIARAEQKVVSAQAEVRYYRRLYDAAQRVNSLQDLLTEAVQRVVTPIAVNPVSVLQTKTAVGKAMTPQTAVALLSDTHTGELVSLEQTGGLNQYDFQIFNRRMNLWVQKIINLISLRRSRVKIPRLVVPMIGDMLSGEIHDELVKTNVENIVAMTAKAASITAQALVQLSKHFDSVFVPCVVGRHGRTTRKIEYKDRYVNWDYIFYQLVASFVSRHENINFQIPKSFWTIIEIEQSRFLLWHGDDIQMWNRIPWYGIERSIGEFSEILQNKGEVFDMILMGHFHTPIETSRYIVNGAFKGGDEFALGKLRRFDEPVQVLLYVHPMHGIVGTEKIYLKAADDRTELGYSDSLPEVWTGLREVL